MLGPGRYARLAVGTRSVFLLVRLQPLALANLRWKPGSAAARGMCKKEAERTCGQNGFSTCEGQLSEMEEYLWHGGPGAGGAGTAL